MVFILLAEKSNTLWNPRIVYGYIYRWNDRKVWVKDKERRFVRNSIVLSSGRAVRYFGTKLFSQRCTHRHISHQPDRVFTAYFCRFNGTLQIFRTYFSVSQQTTMFAERFSINFTNENKYFRRETTTVW